MSNDIPPCDKCICLAICKVKRIKHMFNNCNLINTFCSDQIDGIGFREVAQNISYICEILNEILDRYLVPCYTGDGPSDSIGIADVDPAENRDSSTSVQIRETYDIFKRLYKIDLLLVEKTKEYLSDILREGTED